MEFIAEHRKSIFIGQAVGCPGTAMSDTLKDISKEKLMELPVAEEFQLGMAIGMALDGWLPVCIYPRWNFLLLAVNQLVNHLDKISEISDYEFNPQLIIRTSIGSERPLFPQKQHIGDFSNAFKSILNNIEIITLEESKDIFPAYKKALKREDNKSTLIVEYGDFYNEK